MAGTRQSRLVLLLSLLAGALVVLGLAVVAGAGFTPADAVVVGSVVDQRTGLPVAGASLRGGGRETVTDEAGRFTFETLPVATLVEVTKAGYEPSRERVASSGRMDVELAPRALTGTVRDAVDGRPIAGAQAKVGDRASTTDTQGRFEVLYAAAEEPLVVQMPGYGAWSLPSPGEGVEVRLKPNVLQVEVVSSDGDEPLAGARVQAGGSVAETDHTGRARVPRLREGEVVRVEAHGFDGAAFTYQGQAEARVSLAPRSVRGAVTNAQNGKPLSRVIVTDGRSKTVTDEDGRYQLSRVGEGDQLVASVDGYEQTEADVDGRAEIDIALRPLPRSASGPDTDHLPPGTLRETFVAEAKFPVAMAFAPDGRLFYNELRTGLVRVVENGVLRAEPFYDFTVAGQPETGLLGIAIDPDFANNGYVYVFYTEAQDKKRDGDTNGPNKVVRLTERNGVGTEPLELLELPSGYIHNAGNLHFGPDGKLYVSLGNTDKDGLSQDLSSPAGKILRLNSDASIPEDNPFAGDAQKHGGVYAYGLRNSYDFTFHPVTKELYATENGPGDNDELNLIRGGQNYGWPASGPQNKPGLTDPILAFDKVIAPTGVEFYRGNAIGAWQGDLFYCSYHGGELRRIVLEAPGYERILADQSVAANCRLDVLTGPDGALYFSDVDAIYRIRAVDSAGLPAPAALTSGTATPGAGSQTTPTPNPRAQSDGGGPVQVVEVLLDEWSIKASPAEVRPGRVRFEATNVGNTVHSLGINGNGVKARTEDYPAGETRTLEVTLAPGTYELDCPVGGHTELGMHARFTVR